MRDARGDEEHSASPFPLHFPPSLSVKLLLIDGHYYVYRSFFAIRDLRKRDGTPTNAIYGFVKTVRKMVADLAPDLGAVMWDMGLPQRRVALQPAYKQQRTEMPDEMRPQLDFIQRLVPMLGLVSLGVPDTEADDLMATYTVAARARGDTVVLAANDKDLFQLVNEHVRVYSTNKTDLAAPADAFALLGAEAVRRKWNVEPAQIGEVLALVGDSVDNIPGVEGIGPKTAATLMAEHGTVDALLANLDAVKNEKLRAKLEAARAQIVQNREMVRLDLDLPLPAPLDALRIAPRYPELIAALESCEFKGLTAEVKAEGAARGAAAPAPVLGQGELF
jgi:DNA polymerase-1